MAAAPTKATRSASPRSESSTIRSTGCITSPTACAFCPSTGGTVALTLNGYGSAPQVFNVPRRGQRAGLDAVSLAPEASPDPVNSAPVLPGGFRPAGVPDPTYGGGSLIVQATGGLVLDGGVSYDFVFPRRPRASSPAARSISTAFTVDNGWTTGGQAWQGMFFEAPVITSSAGLIDVRASDNNWINFNVKPNVGVRAWQLTRAWPAALRSSLRRTASPPISTPTRRRWRSLRTAAAGRAP